MSESKLGQVRHSDLSACAERILLRLAEQDDLLLSVEFTGMCFATNRAFDDAQLRTYHQATPAMLVPWEEIDLARITKIAVDGCGRKLDELDELLAPFDVDVIPAMSGTFANIVGRGVDKSRTIRMELDQLGIPPRSLAAFGDDLPDLGMLREAGLAIAMGNAVEAVKAVSAHVIGDCDTDAIGVFLRKYVLGPSTSPVIPA